MTAPLGYITLWELVARRMHRVEIPKGFDDDTTQDLYWEAVGDAEEEIVKMILSGALPLFLERGDSIRRIPGDDLSHLGGRALSETVHNGRFPQKPKQNANQGTQTTHELSCALAYDPRLEGYCGERPLIKDEHAEVLFPQKIHDVPQRSGAPGKPSSMHLILDEHERRRVAGKTAQSREAEGEALAAWLRATHPTAPPAKAKTIRDKLPPSFQPFNGRLPK
jgi:hypothetical protein